MPATDQADYFSTQVVRTRRFFLPEGKEKAESTPEEPESEKGDEGDGAEDRA